MPTITLCVPMQRCEWLLCSHKHEKANVWHNAIGKVLQPWQREERADYGQRGKSFVILYRRCHESQCELA